MVAETWILKMGNQVSHNLKHALYLEHSTSKKKPTKKPDHPKEIIGILSFEVANVMSKTIHLHKSLRDQDINKLKNEILKSEGVKNLVSSNESYLLELAMAEKLEDLNRVASVVSRLGKKCTEPALLGFEHVYGDIMNGVIDVRELGFLVKDMEGMVRKMERYVNATLNLYSEMEVLNELEQATKKFQQNQHEESRRAFEQKLIWQKQDVRHLKDVSIWNQTYDKVVELLARTVCTIYARICVVFGVVAVRRVRLGLFDGGGGGASLKDECGEISVQIDVGSRVQMGSEPLKRVLSKRNGYHSGVIERAAVEKRGTSFKPQIDSRRGEVGFLQSEEEGKHHSGAIERAVVEKSGVSVKPQLDPRRSEVAFLRAEDFIFPCGASPGRLFMECLSLSSSGSKLDDDVADRDDHSSQTLGCRSVVSGVKKENPHHSGYFSGSRIGVPLSGDQRQSMCGLSNSSRFGAKSRLTIRAPLSTIGGSALALHYANVIIVIEKLLRYPHLVGEEARDDLYQMLPTSLRVSLRTNLKSYVKNLAIYDAPVAHDWKATLDEILRWLAPLAHNMIRWQSERNFEQQQIVTRTNVLLLETLYFADREKTEAAICELLVGLNYICRYEHQQNALLDCASSFDFDDCMEWQMQSSYLH